jgi:hypothetical protein
LAAAKARVEQKSRMARAMNFKGDSSEVRDGDAMGPGERVGEIIWGGSAGAFGSDDVFAVEAVAEAGSGLAGAVADALVAGDGFEAVALFGGVEDFAAFAPGGWDFGGEIGLVGEVEAWLHGGF